MLARTHRVVILVLTLLCASMAHAQEPAQAIEVVRVDTSLVTINVAVTDAKDKYLSGLKSEDFIIKDEGRKVNHEFIDNRGPVSIVLIVDISSSMRGKWERLTSGLRDFLKKANQQNDYSLVIFNEHPTVVATSANAVELWRCFKKLSPSGETALYDAVLSGLSLLPKGVNRHQAVILVSDGEDNASKAKLADVKTFMRERWAAIYTVGVLQHPSDLQPEEKPAQKLLKELAASTGGLVVFPGTDDIPYVLARISEDVSNQYTFSYYPEEKTPGWRRIEVNLPQLSRQYKLRYQQSYLMKER